MISRSPIDDTPRVPLGEICEIVGGGTPKRSNAAYFNGEIPWATPTDVTGLDFPKISMTKERITESGMRNSSARLVPAGTVLMTSRATIGYTAVAITPITTNQGFANFICSDSIHPDYLSFWLRHRRRQFIDLANGTTFKEISKSTLRKVMISLPPLSEQRQVANILYAAAQVTRLRKKMGDCMRRFAPALFVNMFGDPVENPMGWKVGKIGDVGISIDTGFACAKSRLVDDGLLHLRPFNVGRNAELDMTDTYRIPHGIAPRSRDSLRRGDILFNNTNSRELVGKAALVREDIEAGFSNHMTRVRLDTSVCDPEFATGCLLSLWLKGYFRERCTQWIGQAAYGSRLIAQTPILLPPLEEQRRFGNLANRAARGAASAKSAAASASALTAALSARLLEESP